MLIHVQEWRHALCIQWSLRLTTPHIRAQVSQFESSSGRLRRRTRHSSAGLRPLLAGASSLLAMGPHSQSPDAVAKGLKRSVEEMRELCQVGTGTIIVLGEEHI